MSISIEIINRSRVQSFAYPAEVWLVGPDEAELSLGICGSEAELLTAVDGVVDACGDMATWDGWTVR